MSQVPREEWSSFFDLSNRETVMIYFGWQNIHDWRPHWETDIPKGLIFLLQLTSRTSAEGVLKAEQSRTGLLHRWTLMAVKSGIVHRKTFRSQQFDPDPGLGKFMRKKRTVAIFQLSELIRGQCYLKKN